MRGPNAVRADVINGGGATDFCAGFLDREYRAVTTRADFSPLVEHRDIDFARASLPNVGGITEMLKIMDVCDTHKVGIVPHFTGPIATAGHMHTIWRSPVRC